MSLETKEQSKTKVVLVSLVNGDKVVGVNEGDTATYGKYGNIKVLKYAFLITLDPIRTIAYLDSIEVYYDNIVFLSMLEEGNPIYQEYKEAIKRLSFKNLSERVISSFARYE
ncbi:hypothetical protein [Thermovibrio ammonificans]|jgi:hypothetical protein